jgi:hypothetical protein
MMAHPLALQLRNLQSLVEIGVDKNTTVVFPAPIMTTISELGNFIQREKESAAANPQPAPRAAVETPADTPALEASELPALSETTAPEAEAQPANWPTR